MSFIAIIIFNLIIFFNIDFIIKKYEVYDYPDKVRKIHKKKISLSGGLIIFLNFFFIFFCYSFDGSQFENLIKYFFNNSNINLFLFLFYLTVVFLFGFFDDKFNIRANIKFIFLLIFIFFSINLDSSLVIYKINFSFSKSIFYLKQFEIFFTILCFLLFINAFNMFDGINLQSAFYSLFLLFIFLVIGFAVEIIIILILSLLFFSYLNYNNKCFLGDNGSLLIAFILSFLFIKSYNSNYITNADQIFLLMMIPGVDLLRLAITRIYNGKHPFRGDRDHFHHNILEKYGYNKTILITFFIIVIPNIVSLILGGTLYLILLSGIIYSVLLFSIKK